MKIYYLSYVSVEHGEIETFKSKKAATKRFAEIKREHAEYIEARDAYYAQDSEKLDPYGDDKPLPSYDQLPRQIDEVEFPITAQGILDAFECGAAFVSK